MNAEVAVKRGKLFLDEATENLTFGEFLWAFEEAWHGAGWVLNALRRAPAAELSLGNKGELPRSGSLLEVLRQTSRPPREAKVVGDLEAMRERLAEGPGDLPGELPVDLEEEIVALVFEVWKLHDACSLRVGMEDDRLEGKRWMIREPSPGKHASPVIARRTALKMLAIGGAGFLQACTVTGGESQPAKKGDDGDEADGDEAVEFASVQGTTPIRGMHWPTADPFLFCAYHTDQYPAGDGEMAPAASLAGRHIGRDFEGKDGWRMYHGRRIPGFPRHPHRGFETVTFVRTGVLDHADSLGATARYGAGDVQWLTAGGGIQHSEMFPLINEDGPNPLDFFQIWVNLPRESKMVDPYFRMLWSETIPRVTEVDEAGRVTELTLAAGAYKEHVPPAPPPNSWASREEADLAIWTLRMEAGARLTVPAVNEGTRRYLYVHSGAGMKVADQEVANDHRVEVSDAGPLVLENGPQETQILWLQARPIGEPVASRGPFVMNTQEEIEQAYRDFQQTQFGGWPWRGGDPVHDKEKGRFAVLVDGSRDEPG